MVNSIENIKRLPITFCRDLIREKLEKKDNDIEIETDTLRASLICPLTALRINIPGRSKKCKHLQCFDLQSYLSMNRTKPKWKCPVCNQQAIFSDLGIDRFNIGFIFILFLF